MRVFLALWSALWTLFLPIILAYLWRRGRKDGLYWQHLAERFGRYPVQMQGSVWVHAVSLGEVRSAVPLVRRLLQAGERVVITHFTPAGRRASLDAFGAEIAAGQLAAVWVPFELDWCFASFLRSFQPKLGLVMEIEIWPRMVQAAKDRGVPLLMCNAQYPQDSMARDARFPLRPAVMRRFAGAFVKSQTEAARFASIGVKNITVTGELRFDQPIPQPQIAAAQRLRPHMSRPILAFASVTQAEEALFIETAANLRDAGFDHAILFIPRAPERFEAAAQAIAARGLTVARRSALLGAGLWPQPGAAPDFAKADVILGDSLGEMYFYLALASRAVVGGGFQPKGSHNIIEPLALGLPVLVGPHIQTITFPAIEAIAAGVCKQTSAKDLARDIMHWPSPTLEQIAAFQREHLGASEKTFAALAPLLR